MARKAITFLGTGNYQPATYKYQGKSHTGQFFGVALTQFYQLDVLQVVMTDEARQKHWECFQQKLREVAVPPRIEEINIPTGKHEEDLWDIFDTIANHIEPGDQLIFDITHSFRSLPLIVLLIAGYIRVVKQVEVEALVYGAYEAKEGNVAPVFDLTPFVRLLDWTAATDMFLKTGRAKELAELVKKSAQEQAVETTAQHSNKQPDPKVKIKSRWNKASEKLDSLSRALGLTRPMEAMQSASDLIKIMGEIEALRDSITHPTSVRPFELLLEQIVAQFESIALHEPEKKEHHQENLDRQKTILRWYQDRQQYVQAITLARELIVSQKLVAKSPDGHLKDLKKRKIIEEELNDLSYKYREKCQISSEEEVVAKLWDELSSLRNDIAHGGMRQDARKSKDIPIVIDEMIRSITDEPMSNP